MEPKDIKLTITYRKKPITTDKLYQKLENKMDKGKLDKWISMLDALDNKQDQVVDVGHERLQSVFNQCLNSGKGIDADGNITNGTFNHKDMLILFGCDVSVEFELFAEAIKEIEEDEKNEFIAKYADIPPAILEGYKPDEILKIEKTEEGYKIIDNDGNYTVHNDEGKQIHSLWIQEDCKIITYYDNDNNPIKSVKKYNNGLIETQERNENGFYKLREFGKTSCHYNEYDEMDSITVNKGLPNETSFKIIYDENYLVIDIVAENENPTIKFDDLNKQALMRLLNSVDENCFAKDFDIKTEGNYVNVEPLYDNNANPPANAETDIK